MTDTHGDTPLASYTLAQLYAEAQGIAAVQADFKARGQAIQGEIEGRLAPYVKAALAGSDKTHGTIRAVIDNAASAKIDISKKVDWDSTKLMAVANSMPWEKVKQIFKIEFSIPEKTYGGLMLALDPLTAQQIEAARTVKYSEPKVTLVMESEAV